MAGVSTTAHSATPLGRPASGRRVLPRILRGRNGALIGYCLAALVIYVGWLGRDERNISAEEGLGYWLGIAGASLMALLFFYALRKRYRWLRFMGATKAWFHFHMVGGIIGPILILYHCNFQLGSLNSRVALYCTLLVPGSGIFGRYLYVQIHQGLSGHKTSLKELTRKIEESVEKWSAGNALVEDLRHHLIRLDEQVLTPPNTLLESILRPFVVAWRTRWAYVRLRWELRKKLIARAVVSPAVAQHKKRLEAAAQAYLRQHLRLVRKVAQFALYERLFSYWHIIHVPFFLMMITSAVVHILAVHMY
jgi:hypothetical protein